MKQVLTQMAFNFPEAVSGETPVQPVEETKEKVVREEARRAGLGLRVKSLKSPAPVSLQPNTNTSQDHTIAPPSQPATPSQNASLLLSAPVTPPETATSPQPGEPASQKSVSMPTLWPEETLDQLFPPQPPPEATPAPEPELIPAVERITAVTTPPQTPPSPEAAETAPGIIDPAPSEVISAPEPEPEPVPGIPERFSAVATSPEPEIEVAPVTAVTPAPAVEAIAPPEPAPVTIRTGLPKKKTAAAVEKVKGKRGRKSLKQIAAEADLIDIPDDETLFKRQYYSMGEVAEMFRVNQSLLRFWETEFDILQPRKNKKGDRHFRPIDIKNLHLIYHLLRQRKYTIEGAKDFLKKNKKADQRFETIQRLQQIRAFLLELKAQL